MQNQPTAQLAQTSTPIRVQFVRVCQIIGVILGAIGGAEFLDIIKLLPADVSKFFLVFGPAFASAAKPMILLLGDIADDGERNDSFKLPLLFFALVLFLPSCALAARKGNGIALQHTDPTTGQVYTAGLNFGADGKPTRAVFEWFNSQGIKIRLVENLRRNETAVFVKVNKVWMKWPLADRLVLVDKIPSAVDQVITPSSK